MGETRALTRSEDVHYGELQVGVFNLAEIRSAMQFGVYNESSGYAGAQFGVANFANHADTQVGVLVNGAGRLDNLQIGGIGNGAANSPGGAQIAGLFNVADTMDHGFQVAGFGNVLGMADTVAQAGAVNIVEDTAQPPLFQLGVANMNGNNYGVLGGVFLKNGVKIGAYFSTEQEVE